MMPSITVLITTLLAFTSTAWALPHSIRQIRSSNDAVAAAAPPRLVAYIQTFRSVDGGPLSLLPLLQEQTGVTHILLSAVHLNEQPGDITLNDNHPNDPMYDNLWSEVKQLQDGGIKVMMMLGGAARGTFERLSGDDASVSILVPAIIHSHTNLLSQFHAYYDPLLAILRAHNIQGLDIDIEESVPISMPLRLLRQLHTDLGADFILTMAPVASALLKNGSGLHGFPQHDMDDQATEPTRPNGKLVSWYNAQFYNGWGDASSTDMYDRIVSEGGWSPDRIVMGVLTNPGDGGSGFVQLPTLKSVVGSLGAKHATFGCAVGWEYWAAGTGDGIAEPWMWVKALGDVIAGFASVQHADATSTPTTTSTPSSNETISAAPNDSKNGTSAEVQPSSTPMKDPPTPWPSQMAQLKSVGAGHWDSVRALNMTNGDTKAAGDMLGVADLIDQILGETQGLVSGALGSLSVI
jgi:chitinase